MCKNIPDDLLHEENPDTNGIGFARAMGCHFYGASQVMNCGFDPNEFEAECVKQFGAMGKFAKVKYGFRFFSTLSKTGRGDKK